MSVSDDLANLLTGYFHDEFYRDGIAALRRDILHPDTARRWKDTVSAIRNRALPPGDALHLVNYKANQVLEENTDEEAYIWLDQMIQNVERTDGRIEEYPAKDTAE